MEKLDARFIKSVKSPRSKRSTRDGPSHVSRMRSRAMSNARLRLPRALRTSSATHAPSADVPPIPALPDTSQRHSFLGMGMRGTNISDTRRDCYRCVTPNQRLLSRNLLIQLASCERTSRPSGWQQTQIRVRDSLMLASIDPTRCAFPHH